MHRSDEEEIYKIISNLPGPFRFKGGRGSPTGKSARKQLFRKRKKEFS